MYSLDLVLVDIVSLFVFRFSSIPVLDRASHYVHDVITSVVVTHFESCCVKSVSQCLFFTSVNLVNGKDTAEDVNF